MSAAMQAAMRFALGVTTLAALCVCWRRPRREPQGSMNARARQQSHQLLKATKGGGISKQAKKKGKGGKVWFHAAACFGLHARMVPLSVAERPVPWHLAGVAHHWMCWQPLQPQRSPSFETPAPHAQWAYHTHAFPDLHAPCLTHTRTCTRTHTGRAHVCMHLDACHELCHIIAFHGTLAPTVQAKAR